MDNQRNLILAIVLSLALLLGFDLFLGKIYPTPKPTEQAHKAQTVVPTARPTATHSRDGGLVDPGEEREEAADLTASLHAPGRVAIDAPEVAGSINSVGARLDDLVLKTHRQTVDKNSGPVRIFSPAGTPAQEFAQFGWVAPKGAAAVKLPDAQTQWVASGGPLAPNRPVTLTWDNGAGQRFTIRYSIDQYYMVTAEQTVANTGPQAVTLQPYAFLNRTSRTASQDIWNLHSGPIGLFDDKVDFGWNYKDVDKAGTARPEGQTGWIGFTDIYWLSALIPQAGAHVAGDYRARGGETYSADMLYDPVQVAPGAQVTRTTRLFAGAKESTVLDKYEDAGVSKFGLSIDWGWFRWFMYPIFWLLREFYRLTGNFGVAIMLLTVVVRAAVFPIAQKGFASMAAMRSVQPKMKALQERYKDDKQRLSQEMAKLYKEEKVNPLTGCLPLLIQFPIFFALYKTLLVAIEMRHKPFVLWIKDLSAPDPLHFFNLFGLLHFTPPSFLGLGVLALLLGITMFFQFRLNPAQLDPVQQQMFAIMPWVMMFVMSPFAAGLLLYWITSNVLTIAQQSYLYSRHPQLKASIEKDKVDKERAAERAKG